MPEADLLPFQQVSQIAASELIHAVACATLLCNCDGVIFLSNPAANLLFGCESHALAQKRVADLFPDLGPLHNLVPKVALDTRALLQDGSSWPARLQVAQLNGRDLFAVSITDRRASQAIETELERERKRLADMVSLAPAVFCSFGIDQHGHYFFPYAGTRFAELLGIRLEHINHDLHDLHSRLAPAETKEVEAAVRISGLTMTPWRAEFRIPHPVRGERWLEAQFTPDPENTEGLLWHGFLNDITDRKHTETYRKFLLDLGFKIQRASDPESIAATGTRMLAHYFGSARCILSSVDLERMEGALIHEHVAHGPPSPTGIVPLKDWANGDLFRELLAGNNVVVDDTSIHPGTRDNYSRSFQPAGIEAFVAVPLCRGKNLIAIITLTDTSARFRRSGDALLVRAAADRVWPAYEAARALAGQRESLQSLTDSEQRLQIALQAGSIGIWEADPVTGRRTLDARCQAMFGLAPGDSLDQDKLLSFIVPEDRERVTRQLIDYRDPAGTGHFNCEYRIVSPVDGGTRYIFAQGQMIFEKQGLVRKPVRAIGTLQDLTALKQRELALRRANSELEAFAYAAAHDLQEPLRNVGLAAQLLVKRHRNSFDLDSARLLTIADDGARLMEAMVKDLLFYSKIPALDETAVPRSNANLVLTGVLGNLKSAIQASGARLSWDVLPTVSMKGVHLALLFQHLISNSLKFTIGRTPLIHVGSGIHAKELVLSVKDNGRGVPEQLQERAFGVFKRLHGKDTPGTGMGLAICKRIVEYYGGRIWMESQVDVGATVLFTVKPA